MKMAFMCAYVPYPLVISHINWRMIILSTMSAFKNIRFQSWQLWSRFPPHHDVKLKEKKLEHGEKNLSENFKIQLGQERV